MTIDFFKKKVNLFPHSGVAVRFRRKNAVSLYSVFESLQPTGGLLGREVTYYIPHLACIQVSPSENPSSISHLCCPLHYFKNRRNFDVRHKVLAPTVQPFYPRYAPRTHSYKTSISKSSNSQTKDKATKAFRMFINTNCLPRVKIHKFHMQQRIQSQNKSGFRSMRL